MDVGETKMENSHAVTQRNEISFIEFVMNVHQWSSERGIYKYSTPQMQLLKAFEECCELSDAMLKMNMSEALDAVGDIAVCIVNVSAFYSIGLDKCFLERSMPSHGSATLQSLEIQKHMHTLTKAVLKSDEERVFTSVSNVFSSLKAMSDQLAYPFEHCLATAWNAIKDRKGKMVPGGTFVKDE